MPGKAFDVPKSSKKGAKRPLLRQVPVGAHLRELRSMGEPGKQPIVEKMSQDRLDMLPSPMKKNFVEKSKAALDRALKSKPEKPATLDKYLAKAPSPTAAASCGEAGPSGVTKTPPVSPVTKNKGKKRSRNQDDVPHTPAGLPDELRDGKIAAIKVYTPSPRRSPRGKAAKSEVMMQATYIA
jgi:hypothetical protein